MQYESFDSKRPAHRNAEADPELDPCSILERLEEQLLDEYSLNLKGHTMNNPSNPVLPAAVADKLVHTRYTDLLDVIEDKITDSRFKARLLPSLAWMIDSTLTTTTRQFILQEFRFMREADDYEPVEGVDALDTFVKGFAGSLDIEHVFGTGGLATTVAQLCRLRQDWHDAASSAMDADNRVYEPKSLEALINGEKVREMTPQIRSRQKLLIKTMVEMNDGDSTDEAELTQMFEARYKTRAAANIELSKRMGPAVLDVISIATRHCPETIEFTDLDKVIRERLFKVALKFAMNAVSDLSERNMSDFEYGMVLMEFKAFKKSVEFILKTQYADEPHSSKSAADRTLQKVVRENDTPQVDKAVAADDANREAGKIVA